MITQNTPLLKINEDIAEFVGALIGDGYIYTNKNKYIIGFTGNPITDKEYYEYLRRLINIAWKKEVKIKLRGRGIRIVINSKNIVNFLINEIQIKHGINKSESVVIPEVMTKDWSLTKLVIRGIVDTDGSVFVSKKPGIDMYPSIEITTSSPELAFQLRNILLSRGFRVAKIWSYKSKLSKRISYKVPLNGLENVDKWLKEIGFSNPYKLKRAKEIWDGRDLNPRHSRRNTKVLCSTVPAQ